MNVASLLLLFAAAQPAGGGFDITPVVVALVAGLLGAVPGTLAFRASSRANDVNARKVDQEAYDRAIAFHSRMLDEANRQLDRVTAQLDRVTAQLERVNQELSKEQSGSRVLQQQVRALEQTVELLNATIADLRSKLSQRMET